MCYLFRYTTKTLNEETTPKTIKAMLAGWACVLCVDRQMLYVDLLHISCFVCVTVLMTRADEEWYMLLWMSGRSCLFLFLQLTWDNGSWCFKCGCDYNMLPRRQWCHCEAKQNRKTEDFLHNQNFSCKLGFTQFHDCVRGENPAFYYTELIFVSAEEWNISGEYHVSSAVQEMLIELVRSLFTPQGGGGGCYFPHFRGNPQIGLIF